MQTVISRVPNIYRERVYYELLVIEVMHKAWHDTSAVKVGHFEWLTMYTGVTGQKTRQTSFTKTSDDTLVE